ncbi:D-Ala-D-Ala carboxypeptidase family metallohydrolase [Paraburkholderia sp. BR14263]|uniref:D-Ala-D-Ala carboxypeptidase family metallohydrolase n=1 Tax=unclassified Paraburkholderia TaxID=2615204 RepID=UPI0034CE5D36
MKLTPNFTVEELSISETATRHGISNDPGPAELANLLRLAVTLEDVRTLLGDRPVIVTSGFRAPGVNRLVGGAANSDHPRGLAADFICPGFGSPLQICATIEKSRAIEFDQLIFEGTWVHLSVPAQGRQARQQVLTAYFGAKGTTYLKGLP